MIHGIRLHRSNQADVIRHFCGVRQNFAQLHSALTVFLVLEFRAEQCGIRVDECGSVSLQQFRWRQLTVTSGKFRLVVEHFQVTGSPGIEHINDTLGFAGEMRLLRSEWIGRIPVAHRCRSRIARKQRTSRDGPQPKAAVFQEPSARH